MNPTGSGSNFTKKNNKKKIKKKQQENNKKSACTCKTLRGARMEMTYPFKIRFVILKYRNNQVNDCFLELCCKLCSVFLFALQHVHHEKQGREKKQPQSSLGHVILFWFCPDHSYLRDWYRLNCLWPGPVLVLPRPLISQEMVWKELFMAQCLLVFIQNLLVENGVMK